MNTTNENSVANNSSTIFASRDERLPVFESFVHTCEIKILPRTGMDLQHDLASRKAPRRITNWRSGNDKRQATARFNANNELIKSPCTGNLVRRGNCKNLNDFEKILTLWAEQSAFMRSDIRIKRVDFALDCYRDEDAASFRKLCDLMIACFSVHHGVDDRNSYYGETFMTIRPKNNKATAPKVGLTFERYAKIIQQPDHGAVWRTELRYKYPRKTTGDPLTAFNKLVDELRCLPSFIETAEDVLNENLFRDFQQKQAHSSEQLKVSQYILENDDRFFSHRQIRKFYALVHGINEEAAESRAHGYIRRHQHLFITKRLFRDFIKAIIASIRNYASSGMFLSEKTVA